MVPQAAKRKKPSSGMLAVARDILISVGIVMLILASLYAYTGVWPPMVVIESSSMMHGSDSEIGIIDTGDLTLVKSIHDRNDVVTYLEAMCATDPNHGFKTYGDYGNVIVYRKNGLSETPVIHRAIAWVEYNATPSKPPDAYRGDIPDIGVYNVSEYTVYRLGYMNETITIDMQRIFTLSAASTSHAPHSGFITKGDHNRGGTDQVSLTVTGGGSVEPVKADWVVGKAEGELPWFGLFKLWISGQDTSTFPKTSVYGLVATVFLLIAVPMAVDFILSRKKRKKEDRKQLRERNRKNSLK